MLQVPFFICNYLLPNLQKPCSTLQEANHSNVLFTPESSNASYSHSKASHDCTSILKRFHTLFVPLCTLIQCLVLAMPPQSLKIDRLPSDASAILVLGRYLLSCHTVLIKRLSKQWWGWWFETPSSPWWPHCNVFGDARSQNNSNHAWYLPGYHGVFCFQQANEANVMKICCTCTFKQHISRQHLLAKILWHKKQKKTYYVSFRAHY